MPKVAAPTANARPCDFTPGCSRPLFHPGNCCVPVDASTSRVRGCTRLRAGDAILKAPDGEHVHSTASATKWLEANDALVPAADTAMPEAVAPQEQSCAAEAPVTVKVEAAEAPKKRGRSEAQARAPPESPAEAAEAPVTKKRGRPPKPKAQAPLESPAEAAGVDETPCKWPGCTLEAWHLGLCNFADSTCAEGPQRCKRAAAPVASSALGGSSEGRGSAGGSGGDAATTASHKVARRVSPLPTQSASPPVASITPTFQAAERTSIASEPPRPFAPAPAQSSSTTALTSRGPLQSQDEVQTSQDPSLLHPGLQSVSCLSADEMRATLSSLGVRPKKRKAEMSRQLRALLQSTSAADAGLAGSAAADTSEESEHGRLCRVLADRLTQGRDAEGNMYFIEDDEEEPWTDECDGCRKAHPSDGRGAERWFKCLRCPSVDLCSDCAVFGCREHGRRHLLLVAAPAGDDSDGGACAAGGAGAGTHLAPSDAICGAAAIGLAFALAAAGLGGAPPASTTRSSAAPLLVPLSAPLASPPPNETRPDTPTSPWTPQRDVCLLDAVWTHRMNFHTVAQVVGGPPGNRSTGSGSDPAASFPPLPMGSLAVAPSLAARDMETRLSELLQNASLDPAAQTYAPLLTPPVELATIGAPPSAAFRLGLSGALPAAAAVEDVAKPHRASLKALARVSPASLETGRGWAVAVSAATTVYKPDELHLATPARGLARAHYRVAGGPRAYTDQQLAHAGLRDVREPSTSGAAAKRVPAAARVVD